MSADEAYSIIEIVQGFLDNYVDVIDGPEGAQLPNQAMQLKLRLDEVLTWLEKM